MLVITFKNLVAFTNTDDTRIEWCEEWEAEANVILKQKKCYVSIVKY